MSGFLSQHLDDFPDFFQPIAASIQPDQYKLAIWFLNFLTLPLTWWAAHTLQNRRTHQLISFIAVFMGINAILHVSQCLIFRSLAPGAVTAAFLILPVCILLGKVELQIGILNEKKILLLSLLAILSMPLIVLALLGFSGWILSLGFFSIW